MKYILIVFSLVFLSGCHEYSKSDKIFLSAYLTSQATDMYTTRQCIQAGGREQNPLMPSNPSDRDLFITKGIDTGVTLLLAEMFPKHRKLIFGIGSILRFSVSYNNYQESKK